ncbi:MAG: ribbon-helix-helix protein, CopG family [Sphingomonadaceae bacterium]
MQTARMTILMNPEYKAAIERKAALRGVSSSEHVRNALDSFDETSSHEEAEMAALVAEANAAIPKMRASLERMNERLENMNRKNEAFLKQMGIAL